VGSFGPISASGDGWTDIDGGTWVPVQSIYVVVTATPPNQQFIGNLYPRTILKAGYYGTGVIYGPPFVGTGRVIYTAFDLKYEEQQFSPIPQAGGFGSAQSLWWRFPPGIVANLEVFW
jgi:hypothetical protein